MPDPRRILGAAKTILLVDWPSPAVPRALLGAGFIVFGFSPERYSMAEIVPQRPIDFDDREIFGPRADDERGYLVFRRLSAAPNAVDLVSIYRPVAELPRIIERQVLPLGAKVLWLQPPLTPQDVREARRVAGEHGLVCVDDSDIAQTARAIAAAG